MWGEDAKSSVKLGKREERTEGNEKEKEEHPDGR